MVILVKALLVKSQHLIICQILFLNLDQSAIGKKLILL